MIEYVEILKECGIGRRKSEKMAIDLKNSLKKRGMEVKKEELKNRKKKKDILEINDTYLKEGEEEILE